MKKVVIYVSGGVVQSVNGPKGISVEVFDDDCFDTEEVDYNGRTKEEFYKSLKEETANLEQLY